MVGAVSVVVVANALVVVVDCGVSIVIVKCNVDVVDVVVSDVYMCVLLLWL